ncbi:MAG: protein kinase [Candidatus Hydrogenedentes bacterium]|nr:protein kinase [Candidatus Hydrogenedentota bacterium]
MGTVFEAWDTALQRRVALKVLHSHLLENPSEAGRIVQEARSAAFLSHPNIVRVHTLVEHEGATVIDMEYVEGQSLDAVLESGPLGVNRTVNLLVQILSALETCHKNDTVHLDVKPSNILVTPEGHVFLSDFGLAQSAIKAKRFLKGRTWGTPQYAPPELWSGAAPGKSWDVFSAGVVACQCIAGRSTQSIPIASEDDINRYAEQLLRSLFGVSPELGQLLHRMLAKRIGDRPKDAGEAFAALKKTPEIHRTEPLTIGTSITTMDGETVTLDIPTATLRIPWPALGFALSVSMVVAIAFISLERASDITKSAPQKTQTTAVQPLAPATVPGISSEPGELILLNGRLYFTADPGNGLRELWTAKLGTVPRRIAEGTVVPEYTNPRKLFTAFNCLYFTADSPATGAELYRAYESDEPDGAGENKFVVSLVLDIAPGPDGSDPICLMTHDTRGLFYATTPEEGRDLWSITGDKGQNVIATPMVTGPGGSMPKMGPHSIMGKDIVYFDSFANQGDGLQLCSHTFSDNVTKVLFDISEKNGLLGVIGEKLLFNHFDDQHGAELWIADAATNEVRMLKDITPGSISSNPTSGCVFGNQLFFQATVPDTGEELWITDGTEAGTRLVRDICPGAMGSKPNTIMPGDGYVAIRANDGTNGRELWISDGTTEGTKLLTDLLHGPDGSNPYNNIPNGKYILFSGDNGIDGEELWLATHNPEEWTVQMVKSIAIGPTSSEPYDLVWVDNTHAYFVATDPAIGRELFLVDVAGSPLMDAVTSYDLNPNNAQGTSDAGQQ